MDVFSIISHESCNFSKLKLVNFERKTLRVVNLWGGVNFNLPTDNNLSLVCPHLEYAVSVLKLTSYFLMPKLALNSPSKLPFVFYKFLVSIPSQGIYNLQPRDNA